MSEKRLFLLDSYALIYRSYYAFLNTRMFSSKGVNTSTVFGFMLSLEDIIKNQKPTHIAAAFDLSTPTFRHELYPEYKANRLATPEEIRVSVPIIKQVLNYMNIEIIECPGYEADDVIGTIAKRAALQDFKVFMVTPDKDYCQLVDENIFIYKPKKSGNEAETLGVKEVLEKFSIQNTSQVIDVLALWGDASDNVPGVPGIGEKTAKKLIADYGTVENVMTNLDALSPRQRDSFKLNEKDLYLSKQLVTIETQVPIDFIENNYLIQQPKEQELKALFEELNFKTLINKFFKHEVVVSKPKPANVQGDLFAPVQTDLFAQAETLVVSNHATIDTVSHNYKLVTTDADIAELIETLGSVAEFCFDTETTGLNPHTDLLVGIAFSVKAHEAYYMPIGSNRDEAKLLLAQFRPVFENADIMKIGHNIKFDILFLHYYNIRVNGFLYDTILAHYLLEPEQNHKMDVLAEKYLDYKPVPIEDLIGNKGKGQLNMRNVPIDVVKEYAGEDADITFQLKYILEKKIVEGGFNDLFFKLESRLLKVLIYIELNGFTIDIDFLSLYSKDLSRDIKLLEQEIYIDAGSEFNLASPKQLGDVLFEKLKIPYEGKLTKTKQYSTNEEILQKLAGEYAIINKILEYRGLTKLLSTYVDVLPTIVNPVTNKVHTTFNQSLAVTGRLSSLNPNLQNIPIRDARGREIRRAFIPSRPDSVILSADYSQIELRIMAHICSDANMIDAFMHNADIHTSTAAKVFKVNIEDVTREQRSKAKTANFGIIYGISAFGLAQRMNISRKEASELIDEYFKTFPGVRNYMTKIILEAKEKGYVETIMNRKRFLADINSQNAIVRGVAERNAINAPIQGSAADIIKLAMNNILDEFNRLGLQSTMILQVHDELVFDVLNSELETVKRIVKDKMENAVSLSVPLLVEMGAGANWFEAH